MALPVLQHPAFNITIPSTGEQKKFRVFTVGEEKILLTAAENATGNIADSLAALGQVFNSCAIDPIVTNALTTFDAEWIFVKLREHSVSDTIKLEYTDPKSNTKHAMEVKLCDAKVDVTEKSREVVLSAEDNISMTLGFPDFRALEWLRVDDYTDTPTTDNDFQIICSVIKQVTAGDEVFDLRENSAKEIREFVNSLTLPQLDKIADWIDHLPYVYINVTLPNGQVHKLRDIRRFFV